MSRCEQRFRGFTLIEVLLALALIFILVTPLLSWLAASERADWNRRKEMEAQLALQRTIEEFRAGLFGEVLQALDKASFLGEVRHGYKLLWEDTSSAISHPPLATQQRLREVRLTLFWSDAEGEVNDFAVYLVYAE